MELLAAAVLLARFTVIVPKGGMDHEFEAGYRRHLEWHRSQNDPWPWHGWTILTGERAGVFVDATIDRTAGELDAPVAPAEDRADNERNVEPYGRFASTAIYRLRNDLCSTPTSGVTSPFATMVTVRVRADEREAFEAKLREDKLPAICFALLSGGETPAYLVIKPMPSFSAAVTWQPTLPDRTIESITFEALRYRPDLTYVPEVGLGSDPQSD